MTDVIYKCDNCIECTDKIPFFRKLTEEDLILINKDRYSVRFKADELILKQGITSSHIISLVHGIAKLYVEGMNNKNLLLQLVKPWTLIDEPGIDSEHKNQFSVSALTDVTVCFIDAKNFKTVLERNSKFACEIIRHRSTNSVFFLNRLISLTQKQMLGRIADGLLYLANDIYKSHNFNLTLSRQDIADLTGMSKDSAIRILKELERDRTISMNGRSIEILDPAQLNKISLIG